MALKRVTAAYLLGASFLPSLLPVALFAQDLPSDPDVVAGDIAISAPTPAQLLLQQTSLYGIVDWGSFSIGLGNGVQVSNGNGATLNRVTGGDMSSILGSLTATGSVYLVNPNGIVVGKTGVVNTGGRFVASTLDMTDTDFLNGGDMTFAGASDAYVINLGKVSALGGDVALLAHSVVNDGSLSAPNGTVGVIAGREILMRDAAVADGLFSVKVGGADSSATDAGTIKAAAAELRAKGGNVYALAGNTQGTIEASGVAKVKGRVFLTAGDTGKLTVDKTVTAKTAGGAGGTIAATGGTVDLAGTLDASGTTGGTVVVKAVGETQFDGQIFATGGAGGFVEVSGRHISFAGEVDSGGGTLLIDPDNIEIAFDNDVLLLGNSVATTVLTPTVVKALLVGGDVLIETLGSNGESGTIAVTDAVDWNGASSLTLLASGDVRFGASVQNSSTTGGNLNVVAGWDGSTGAGSLDFDLGTFDASPFDAADLRSQALFGQSTGVSYSYNGVSHTTTGSVVIGTQAATSGIAVGSKTGTTRVYANNLDINGATATGATGGFAQLGFNVAGNADQGTVSGDIQVRAVGDVTLQAGADVQNAAQIGHVGLNQSAVSSSATAAATGSISVEAGGDMLLLGGDASGNASAYALVGNGVIALSGSAENTAGTRSGGIDVTVAGDLVIQPGNSSFTNAAWIGHIGGAAAQADTSLTAGAFYQSTTAQGAADPSIAVDMLALDTGFGDVRVTATASDLRLLGSSELLTCECDYVSTGGDLIVQTSGDLVLGTSGLSDFHYSNQGGGSLILASGGNVTNNAGEGAIGTLNSGSQWSMGLGQWIIYSDRPDHDSGTLGVLTPDQLDFDITYNPADPFDPSALSGNVMVYRKAPAITVADATMTYGDVYTPGAITLKVQGTSEDITDPSLWGIAFSSAYVDDAVATFSTSGFVNAGSFVGALKTNISGSATNSISGYFTHFGDLSVDRATITVTLADQAKDYDGTGGYTTTPIYTGWIGSEDEGLISAGPVFAYSGGDGSDGVNATSPSAPYVVSASGLAETSGNYTFDTTDTANLVINPLFLQLNILNPIDKVYDGTTTATITAADIVLSGFITGEGVTVDPFLGDYVSAHASSGVVSLNATLTAADVTAQSGTLLSNYVLPISAEGRGTIFRKALDIAITGTPSKLFDGTTLADLTQENFAITGFVLDDAGVVTQTVGQYDVADPGARQVTAGLSVEDVSVSGTTDITNYIVPGTATGPGLIATLPTAPPPVTRSVDPFPTTPLGDPTGPTDVLQLINTETTQQILDEINAGANFCREFVQQEYAIDCLSDRLQSVADGLSNDGEYSEVKAALQDAARKLHALALNNASSVLAQTVARSTRGPNRSSSRPLTAISADQLLSANAEARAIIASTEVVLLRSGADSARRRVAFQQVGQIVGSTATLLRSS